MRLYGCGWREYLKVLWLCLLNCLLPGHPSLGFARPGLGTEANVSDCHRMSAPATTTTADTTATSPAPVLKIHVSLMELFTLFALGIFIGAAFCVARLMPGFFSLAAYCGLLSLFHALEYLTTAIYQPTRVGYECTSHPYKHML